MRLFDEFLLNHTLSTSEIKKNLRRILLEERQILSLKASKWDWGERHFFRAMELLNIPNEAYLNVHFRVASYKPMKNELNLNVLNTNSWIYPEQFECLEPDPVRPLLCFVPALAASQSGFRLGYGKGFYDRFLAAWHSHIITIVCLPSEQFFFDRLPTEKHDKRTDIVIF